MNNMDGQTWPFDIDFPPLGKTKILDSLRL